MKSCTPGSTAMSVARSSGASGWKRSRSSPSISVSQRAAVDQSQWNRFELRGDEARVRTAVAAYRGSQYRVSMDECVQRGPDGVCVDAAADAHTGSDVQRSRLIRRPVPTFQRRQWAWRRAEALLVAEARPDHRLGHAGQQLLLAHVPDDSVAGASDGKIGGLFDAAQRP